MTQTILPGGTEAALQALIVAGDMAFDHDNGVVRVGDGVTPGGIVLGDAQTVAQMGAAAIAPGVAIVQAGVAAVQALVDGLYDSVAAGLAATAEGRGFGVRDAGLVHVYRRTGGAAVYQYDTPTAAFLASAAGAAAIGASLNLDNAARLAASRRID